MYKKLDEKYANIFSKAVRQIETTRNSDLENFKKTAKMVISINDELSIMKQILENLQFDIDDGNKNNKKIVSDTMTFINEIIDN